MYYLSLNSLIFHSLLLSLILLILHIDSFLRNIVNIFISVSVGDIFGLVFNSVIVCKLFLMWNNFYSLDFLIVNMRSLIWYIFYSTFSFNNRLLLNSSS